MPERKDRAGWIDLEIGYTDLADLGEDAEGKGIYEFNIVASAKRDKIELEGAKINFFLNGSYLGQDETDEHGKALCEARITTAADSAQAEVKMVHPMRLEKPPLKIKFKKDKKTKEFPEVRVAHSHEKDGIFYMTLIRVNSKGVTMPGEIKYYDDAGDEQVATNGKISLPMKQEVYEKKVFCPERPGVTSPLEIPEIPAKPKRISRKKPEPSFWEQLKSARRKGLGLEV